MSRSSSGNSTPKHISPSGGKSILSGHIAKAGEKVWVAVRLRPLLPAELAANEQEAWRVEQQNTLVPLDAPRLTSGMASTYSRVFGTDVASQTVYEQAGKRLVLSSMEGYNSTIFAYGPTGSGKTFTMQAILQQSAQEIFDHIKQHSTREYIIRVSALEIYNEHVRDLLGDDPSLPLKVMDDPDRGTVADGLTEEGVESVDHLRQLLQRVEERRQTRATESNDKSSRSHEIVRFYIESRPARKQDDTPDDHASSAPGTPSAAPVTISTINLVDLAGSERLPATTSDTPEQEKLRQKETGNINKSLLTLGSCIRALAEAKRFVPYRDSKLTRILQPSLSGNSKMAIVCTISPAAGAVETSKTALHFATTAKRVQMKPVVNEVKNDKTVIARMQLEIHELRAQLAGQDYQHLNAQLKAKDDQIRMTAEEMAAAQHKIDSLQRQILCGSRLRVDSKRDLAGKQAAETTSHSMAAVRASYHVGSMVPSRQVHSDLASAMAALNADKLLLDDYLAGGSRRRARIAAATAGPSSLAGAGAAGAVQTIAEDAAEGTAEQQAIQQLQDPATQRTEEAVAALRNQVRCIQLVQGQTEPTAPAGRVTLQALKQQLSTLQASTTSSTDSSQLQTIHAVQIEIARMEEAEQTHSDASKALASLCKKLGMPDELVPAPRTSSSARDSSEGRQPGPRPRHSSDGAQHASAASAAGSKDSKDTWSSVPAPGSRCQTPAGVGPGSAADLVRTSSQSDVSPYRPSPASGSALGAAAESWPNPQRGSGTPPVMSALKSPSASTSQLPRPSAAARQGSKEDRLQHDQARPSSRQSVDKELTAMLSAFQNFSDQKERLETQKMVLVNQVLKLEYALEQQDEGRKQLQQQLAAAQEQAAALQQQLAEAQHEAEAARMQAAAGSAGGSGPLTHSVSNFSMAAESEESWITGASVEVLLPKIVALWEELYVPLVYRSRFYLGFHNQDAFYYEVEYRRLLWKRNAMFPRDATGRPQRTREVNRAARTLDWERKSIAQQIKWDMTEQEREDLFSSWRVDPLSKERKLQLVQKLWSRDSLAQPDGMQRSSELVVQLCGMDASEHMMELVFGKFQREQEVGLKPSSNKVGFMMNNLMRKVAPPRRRSSGPSALSRPSASLMSSFTSRVNSGLQSLIGRREDSFASMSSFTTARSNAPMSRPGTAGTAK